MHVTVEHATTCVSDVQSGHELSLRCHLVAPNKEEQGRALVRGQAATQHRLEHAHARVLAHQEPGTTQRREQGK